jgi:flagellar biogenesis protein FliO
MPDPVKDTAPPPTRQQEQRQPIPFKMEADGAPPAGGLAVLVVLLALGALAWGALLRQRRRVRAQEGGRALRVVETQRLAPRSYVSVVEFGGQRHLLAQNEHGLLHVASTPAETEAGDPP